MLSVQRDPHAAGAVRSAAPEPPVSEGAPRDGVSQTAAGDIPVGWRRAPLLLLASVHFSYFVGAPLAVAWLVASLLCEAAVYLLVRRVAAGEARWRRAYLVASLCLPTSWVVYAALLWLHGGEAPRIVALCALFVTSLYVVMTNHQDRRLMLGLLAGPALAMLAMLASQFLSALPWYFLPTAMLSVVGMAAIMHQSAETMHSARRSLLSAQADLHAERDALEERVRERTAQLAAASERAQAASLAKSQFIANMSHELRTPLNAVIGYAEILIDDLGAEGLADSVEDARRVRSSGRQLLALINDVLDLAKADTHQLTLNWTTTDIGALMREVVDAARPAAAARGDQLNLRLAVEPACVICDSARLKQALRNLLSNACKFTSEGVIWVSAETESGADGDWLVVEVRDTGVGIASANLTGLFQPFAQGDASATRKYDGAGIGLVITRNIARLMGGDVTAQSVEGEGSVFTFRVPRRVAAPEASLAHEVAA